MPRTKDYFNTFCKISRALGSTLDLEKVLNLIVTSAIETMNGKAACLFLENNQEDVFIPVAQKGLSDNYLHAKSTNAQKEVTEILNGGFLAYEDATCDPRLENHELKIAEGIKSILVVPVMVQSKAVGVLTLYTASHRIFSQEEIDFLTAMAEQGGMAIQNARLIERIRKNTLLFLDLSESINSSLDLQKILHILTANMSEVLDLKAAIIRFINHESQELNTMASYGLSESYLKKGPIKIDKSIEKVIAGETIIIKDISKDNQLQYQEAAIKEGVVSLMIVPIHSREDVIGTMGIFTDKPNDFPEDVILLVEALAHQGGLAIQNATMYMMLQKHIKNMEHDMQISKSWF